MKTVKFKDLPEKVRLFLQREYAFAFILSDSIELDWLHKINEWSKATDEERLAYAEWRYKIGTSVICAYDSVKSTVNRLDFNKGISQPKDIWICNGDICLYEGDKNKWAEIIEEVNVDFNPKSGHWLGEPTFKAGDEVEVRIKDWPENEWRNRIYGCFLFGSHWCRFKDDNYLFKFDEIRKPDPDKVYREIAKEMIKSNNLMVTSQDNFIHGLTADNLYQMLIEAIKKGKEL